MQYNRKTLIIVAIIAIVVLIIVILANLFAPKPKTTITTSDPKEGARSVDLFNPVTIAFSKDVDPNSITIDTSPSENWIIKGMLPNTIELSHKLAFKPSTNYFLKVNLDGKLIGTLSFTTQEAQGDPRMVQTITEQMKIDYPLSRFTPFEAPQYSVVYGAPLILEITLKNKNLTSQEVIDEVKAWVSKNGGNVDDHKYIIVN